MRIAVLTQLVPEVWLEFADSKREGQSSPTPSDGNEPIIQVLLPPEAREMLKSFWEQSLEFHYKDVFDKPKTAQEGIDRDSAWIKYFETAPHKLQTIEIPAPAGARKISDEEARQLIVFLNRAAGDLVLSVKQ